MEFKKPRGRTLMFSRISFKSVIIPVKMGVEVEVPSNGASVLLKRIGIWCPRAATSGGITINFANFFEKIIMAPTTDVAATSTTSQV
jgi:hypothetical protein